MATVETVERLVTLPPVIETRLQDVRRRQSRLRLVSGAIDAFSIFLVVMFLALVADWAFTLFSTEVRLALTLGTVVAGVLGLLLLAFVPSLKRRNLAEVAADVDRSVSALEERWQTVAELSNSKDPSAVAGSRVMADRVVKEAVAKEKLVEARAVVSAQSIKKHQWFLAAAIAAHLVLYVVDGPHAWVLLKRFLMPTSNVSLTLVTAIDGDFAVAHGEPVRLKATVANRNHQTAQVILRDAAGTVTAHSVPAADKDGKGFSFLVDAADKGFDYRFRAGDGETGWHAVTVHDRPVISHVDFHITPPEYTKLPKVDQQELPRKVRAVEGSDLEIVFTADQPLDQFRLEFGKDESLTLEPSATNPQQYLYRTKLTKTIRLTPVLTSHYGLENLRPASSQIVVYPDRAPQVQIVTPDNEISLRPDDKVEIEVAARDDFAVERAELIAFVGDAPDMENAVIVEAPAEEPKAPAAEGEAPSTTGPNGEVAQDPAQTPEGQPNAEQQPGTVTVQPSAESPTETQPPANETQSPTKANPETGGTDPADKPLDGKANGKPSNDDAKGAAKPSPSGKSQPNDAKAKSQPTPAESANAKNDAANAPASSADGTAAPSGEGSDAAKSQPAPPQTIRMQIPLSAQQGEKNVRAKVKLDLSQFKLKPGQQLQYMVRVYDSKNSAGQNRNPNALSADSNRTDQLASNDPRQTSPPANAAAENPNSQQTGANPSGDAKNQSGKNGDSPSQPNSNANNANPSPNNPSPANAASQNPPAGEPGSPDNAQKNSAATNNSSDSSSSSSNQNQQSPPKNSDQSPQDSKGGLTGAPRPPDDMTRRQLDVGSQSTSSSAMKIHIDEWAGSFKGQQRQKLELLIEPVLKDLDAALAKSLEHMAPPAEALKQSKPLDENLNKSLQGAETQIERAQVLVADLVKKTTDTHYAFIGLTLVDITELHVAPARAELKAVHTDTADKQQAHVNQAQFHVTRARQMLADLDKKYEEVKRDAKLAEKMQRIAKMYQIFVEDSMAFMNSQKGTLNPKDRKMAELELDEEFLEKYTELEKQWNEILAELAKALGEDPRLLERYMNSSRRSADTLRDQLTLLNRRQQVLLPTTERLVGANGKDAKSEPKVEKETVKKAQSKARAEKAEAGANVKEQPAAAADIVRGSLQQDLRELSASATDLQENFKTWMPKSIKADDERIAPLVKQTTQLATTAEKAAAVAELESLEAASKLVGELSTQLGSLEQGLSKLTEDGDTQLVTHANRRLATTRRLKDRASAWMEKNTHLAEGRIHRAIEVDQHRLTEDTLDLAGKLDNLQAQLAALPQDVLELAGGLQEILRFDVLVDQMQAELTLRDEDLVVARDHQQNAVKNLARAEEQFDKLIDRVIEEGDKIPPDVPDIDAMQLPTLEQLLAELENEQELAEELGIPRRPTNLQQLRDWMNRNNNSGNSQGQMAQNAGQNALRAMQRANARVENELPTKKVGRWNTLSSRLDDILRQGRGNMPPKQYRRAIEKYFEDISGAESAPE